MARHWEMIGRYDAESTTYTALAGTNGASPYTPGFSGKLIGLRVIAAGGAAATLINGLQFKLTSITFKPNAIEVGGFGCGLMTAPAHVPAPTDWQIDQEVQAGKKIELEGRNVTADTPVTVDVQIWGLFEVS